jgi:hypothetical protein
MRAGLQLQRALTPAALAVFVVSGCGGSRHNGATGTIRVDAGGRIGALRVDVSDRRAVVAFVGLPDAERHGRNTVASQSGSAPYDALGYDCGTKAESNSYAIPLIDGGPYCYTAFFIEGRSERLGLFYTAQDRYVERHGVHVGTTTATAERLLHRHVIVGCLNSIELTRPGRPLLRLVFDGGTITRKLRLRGGHVAALVLHGAKHDPNVFECN